METQEKINALKAWAAKLDQEIQDDKAKDFLLGLAKNWLGDVERGGPASILILVEQMLTQAQKAVSDYGPTVRIVG